MTGLLFIHFEKRGRGGERREDQNHNPNRQTDHKMAQNLKSAAARKKELRVLEYSKFKEQLEEWKERLEKFRQDEKARLRLESQSKSMAQTLQSSDDRTRLLQPIWDQFKEALAQAGIRPWDEFDECHRLTPYGASIGKAVWLFLGDRHAEVDYEHLFDLSGGVFLLATDARNKEEEHHVRCRTQSDVITQLKQVFDYVKRNEKSSEKRKSPADEEKTDFLAQVHAVCAEKKLKAETDKAQADQEVMEIGCRADTTFHMLKMYNLYTRVEKVIASPNDYPNYTIWYFTPAKNIRLWVSHARVEKEEAAEVTIGNEDRTLLRGTIQECVRVVAALLKAPELQQ